MEWIHDQYANSLSLFDAHACAILENNSLTCWGNNGQGRLGLGILLINQLLNMLTLELAGQSSRFLQVGEMLLTHVLFWIMAQLVVGVQMETVNWG